MTAQSRYWIDDKGQEWFAVCPRTEYNIGIPEPPLYKVDWSLTKLWSPVDQVQITDALACSRSIDAVGAPVYVVENTIGETDGNPLLLWAVDGDYLIAAWDDTREKRP